jgi:hypothetical protein
MKRVVMDDLLQTCKVDISNTIERIQSSIEVACRLNGIHCKPWQSIHGITVACTTFLVHGHGTFHVASCLCDGCSCGELLLVMPLESLLPPAPLDALWARKQAKGVVQFLCPLPCDETDDAGGFLALNVRSQAPVRIFLQVLFQ